jgi:hypothetical protein
MQPDPAIDEIRAVRRKISAEFGHDPRRLMQHYKEMEEEMRRSGKYKFHEAPAENPDDEMILRDKPSKK